MPKLRPLRKEEDIANVPPEEPVMIDLTPEGEPEPEAQLAPEPEPRPEPEPDNRTDLQKQIDELKRSEQLAKDRADAAERERTAAQEEVRKSTEELARARGDGAQAQYDAILNAIGAATSELDSAKRDLELAGTEGNWKALADAQDRIATARTRLLQLEDGKAAIEQQREEMKLAPKPEPRPVTPTIEQQIDAMPGLGNEEKSWLKQHPDAMTDQRKNAKLGAAYWDALDKGLTRGTPDYFKFIEEQLGYRKPDPVPEPDDDIDDPQPRRSATVSAPVSRDVPSSDTGRPSNTKVTLTPEQREAARFSGVSETEYARQLVRLRSEKANGNYRESR